VTSREFRGAGPGVSFQFHGCPFFYRPDWAGKVSSWSSAGGPTSGRSLFPFPTSCDLDGPSPPLFEFKRTVMENCVRFRKPVCPSLFPAPMKPFPSIISPFGLDSFSANPSRGTERPSPLFRIYVPSPPLIIDGFAGVQPKLFSLRTYNR